ncbi:SusC/RagA family TonB-linked outer membrane protein [Thermonema rossianum]|uniref:SusC/RagA family TonB-linked outer membrane protein n=1 Tax=Thermonema rossianum TaxID=55505 RepID=UPI00056E6B83|nr:TonB-dependent receptor [Thermonema rossianum]
MRNRVLMSFVLALLTSLWAFAQDRTISGTVKDDQGQPLPGASVYVKDNPSIGTVTDANGSFTLTVPEGATLVVDFVGYQQQVITVGTQTSLDVSLKPMGLEEVVVTSYGTIDKLSISGSVAAVKGEDFENLPLQTFDRAVQGRLSGVLVQATSGAPGGALTFRIRGTGSALASNAPLYIVDGVQIQGGALSGQGSNNVLGGINPNDIESIQVLKDASAAAIYGAQAANGVVIIRTKRGKGKPQFTLNVQEGINQPLNPYKVLNGRQFAQIKKEAWENANGPGSYYPSGAARYGDPDDPNLTNFDWVNELFRTGRLSSYSLSASKGDDKGSFFVSGAYDRQDGQVIKNYWERYVLRLNTTQQLSDRLSLDMTLNVSNQKIFGAISNDIVSSGAVGNYLNSPFFGAFVATPTTSPYNPDGTYAQRSDGLWAFNYNIVQGVNQERREGSIFKTIGSMQMNYQIVEGLKLVAFGGLDYSVNKDFNFRPATIPAFASLGGLISETYRRSFDYNTSVTLNFQRTFADVHNIAAIAGGEVRNENFTLTFAQGNQLPNQGLTGLNAASKPRDVGGLTREYIRQGIFGKVQYNYAGKYYLDATIRRDGTSRFGAKNRYGTFWGVSGAWAISEEDFMDGAAFLSNLKLRVGYGKVGNAEIGNFRNRSTFASAGQYLGGAGLAPNVLGNDLLTWETSYQTNIGLDFGLFADRLYGSVDLWDKKNQDLLLPVDLVNDAGSPNSITGNTDAVIRNRGIDIEIGGVPLDKGDFQWTSSFNISFLQNKVEKLPNNQDRITVDVGAGDVVLHKGQPIGVWWLPEYAGVNSANGIPMYYDTLGNITYQPTQRDNKFLGSNTPKFFGGWNNVFSYKGLSLTVFFQYQIGNKAFNGDFWANILNGAPDGSNQSVLILDRWQQPGDVTNMPKPIEGGVYSNGGGLFASSFYLEDASYVRLKQLTLSYDVPQSIMKSIGARSLRVYVQGLNLWTWTKSNLMDPEVVNANAFNGTLSSTIINYPNPKQFSAGIQLGF